jgi:FixJ family two-component response regulator
MRKEEEKSKEITNLMPTRMTAIDRSEKEQDTWTRHRRKHRMAGRARIIVAAAQGSSTSQIAHALVITVETVRLWRDRGARGRESEHEKREQEAVNRAQRFQDAPRPGAVPT